MVEKKYTATRTLSIDGVTYEQGADLSWWDRADEFVGKSVHLETISKAPDYDGMSLDELREVAKDAGLKVTKSWKRETIIKRLK